MENERGAPVVEREGEDVEFQADVVEERQSEEQRRESIVEKLTEALERVDERAEERGPTASRSACFDVEGKPLLVLRHSEDGRIRLPDDRGYSAKNRTEVAGINVAEQLRLIATLSPGEDPETVALDYEAGLEELDAGPLERILYANASLQTLLSRTLAKKAVTSVESRGVARFAELAQRAGAEARKSVLAFDGLRRPNVRAGRVDQMNVASGAPLQVVNEQHHEPRVSDDGQETDSRA